MIFQNVKSPLQAIKTRSLKSRKIDIFPKGKLMVLVQNGHFSNFFFQATQTKKMSFMIFQNVKTPFQAIKTTTTKSRKIDIFPKGLTRLSRLKKQEVDKVQKLTFFHRRLTHGFGPQMAIFPTFFFLRNIDQGNVFYEL